MYFSSDQICLPEGSGKTVQDRWWWRRSEQARCCKAQLCFILRQGYCRLWKLRRGSVSLALPRQTIVKLLFLHESCCYWYTEIRLSPLFEMKRHGGAWSRLVPGGWSDSTCPTHKAAGTQRTSGMWPLEAVPVQSGDCEPITRTATAISAVELSPAPKTNIYRVIKVINKVWRRIVLI